TRISTRRPKRYVHSTWTFRLALTPTRSSGRAGVAPCPIRNADLRWFNIRRRRLRERMAIRTGDRQPLLAISSQMLTTVDGTRPWCLRQPARFNPARGSWSRGHLAASLQCPVPLSPDHVPFASLRLNLSEHPTVSEMRDA